jgi:hypothetical protein
VVAAGARIGVVEDVLGHCGQESCLHWGLLRGDSYLDPLWLLGLGPVRLLPWWHSPLPATAGADDGSGRPPSPIGPARPPESAPTPRPLGPPPSRRSPDAPPATAPMTRPVSATSPISPAAGPVAIASAGAVALAISWTRSRRRRRTDRAPPLPDRRSRRSSTKPGRHFLRRSGHMSGRDGVPNAGDRDRKSA